LLRVTVVAGDEVAAVGGGAATEVELAAGVAGVLLDVTEAGLE
jgi:hypothetical protein